jgi:hypothetical protein
MQVKMRYIEQFKCWLLTRGITLKLFPMCAFAKHRIEQAKERLRNKLTYEYIVSLPKYKNITRKQYEKLIDSIESVCLVLMESYCRTNNIQQ